MKFVVSSTDLYNRLSAIGKVISNKSTMPILDNFLFELSDNKLTVVASDLESTLTTSLELDNIDGEGSIAIPAKRLTDILKEFAEQPLTFKVDVESSAIEILSDNSTFNIVGQNADEFPEKPELQEDDSYSINMIEDCLEEGIDKTLFATADDELRPVMNGIFVEFTPEATSFVASDAHKLVRYKRTDCIAEFESSFILPKKPASLLKTLLSRQEEPVKISFDKKKAYFDLDEYQLICRLVEGNYPNYNSVIPKDNPNQILIDRVDFLKNVKRVAIMSNQASNLIKLNFDGNQVVISAQDIDFLISADARVNCDYDGEPIEIGFKSTFLQEILSNISSSDVRIHLSDSTRAGLLLPAEDENEDEDVLMLLMPMMINA